MDGILANVVQLENDEREMLPPPPDANVQVVSKRLRALEEAEEVKDQTEQEKVKMDLRLIGVEGLEEVSEDKLIGFAQEVLAKALDQPLESIMLTGAKKAQMRGKKDSPNKPTHLLITCQDMKSKRAILQEKTKLRITSSKLRINSELTAWQSRVKSSFYDTKQRLAGEGKNVFFIGHKLFLDKGVNGKSDRERILLRD